VHAATIPVAEPAHTPTSPKPRLGPLGAQPALSETAAMVQQTMHRFAEDVLRPVGIVLDRMTPDAVIAPDSPFWKARKQYIDLGFTIESIFELPPAERAEVLCVLFEELGWGDAGQAISIGAGLLPAFMAAAFGNRFLMERFPDTMLGCWGITEPDHGSDSLDANRMIFHSQGKYGRPNCVATLDGDSVVINGQKSAWVSNGTIAEVCILYCAADSGNGPDPRRGCVVYVPMDAPGVSRGKPLDKMGQRALNQGEIYFDNVRLSQEYLLAGPEDYLAAVYAIHTFANSIMATVFTGTARSAYELALDYAHERKQGGVPIIRHQAVAHRLFHLARKVECSRALAQRVVHYNLTNDPPALHAGMMAKVTSTQHAFEVASDALQIFGGNGLTREYPIEKILRDARASMIEDGCNEVLAIKGGGYLVDEERV